MTLMVNKGGMELESKVSNGSMEMIKKGNVCTDEFYCKPEASSPMNKKKNLDGASFRSPGNVFVGNVCKPCIVTVDVEQSVLGIAIPSQMQTLEFTLTDQNFVVEVCPGRQNSFSITFFNESDQEIESFGISFRDSYCITRIIFTLAAITDYTFEGLVHMAHACVKGTTATASCADISFCRVFFELHRAELEISFPRRLNLLL